MRCTSKMTSETQESCLPSITNKNGSKAIRRPMTGGTGTGRKKGGRRGNC
jgi:hypothetical protein